MTDDNHENRRRFPRQEQGNKLLVEVTDSPGQPELTGRQLVCYSRDGSISGMRIFATETLPPNTNVDIRFDHTPEDGSIILMLKGITRWCRPSEDGFFQEVGIEITDGLQDDTEHWNLLFSND